MRRPPARAATNYRGGNAVDPAEARARALRLRHRQLGRPRQPRVYRHDNGADPYEQFDFLITPQEIRHIFDNYRRGRQTFSVRAAAEPHLARYNEKMRDGAKGLGLLANIYRDFALSRAATTSTSLLAGHRARSSSATTSSPRACAFDHFARQLARPEAGPHYLNERARQPGAARSTPDTARQRGHDGDDVPNGATGYLRRNVDVRRQARSRTRSPTDKGEYDAEYTMNAAPTTTRPTRRC